jgi:AcrR family transcriptional regulator
VPKLTVEVKEARRSHILAAALRSFARRGYYATTIDAIAAEAGVSKGAPYVYFDSKEELFRELYARWDCGLNEQIEAALAGLEESERRSPRRMLEVALIAVGAHVSENADLCRVLIEVETQAAYLDAVAETVRASQAESLARLEELIEQGKACGEWPAGTDASLHARLILAAINGLMAQWHLEPGSFSWPQIASRLAQAWTPPAAHGGPDPTRRRLQERSGGGTV